MIIKKGDTAQITKNFNAKELFSKSFPAPSEHFLSDQVVNAAQFIRDYVNSPVKINSSYRTVVHNSSIGGAKRSQHLKGTALDLSFSNENILLQLHQSILKKDAFLNQLIGTGINGVGLYDRFIHIDSRPGPFTFWDKRITTKKKFQP